MKKRMMNTARATTTAVKRGLPLGSRVTSVGFGSNKSFLSSTGQIAPDLSSPIDAYYTPVRRI
jgi:hypothetical protein